MKTFAQLLAFFSAALGALHLYRIRSAAGVVLMLPKMMAEALAPYLAVFGFLGALLGLFTRAPLAIVAGLFGLFTSARYAWRVSSSAGNFDQAFGPDWHGRIPPFRQAHMLSGRWTWRPAKPPEPRLEQNVAFWTLPDSDRQLLCDIWQPPAGVPPSGLAFIYFHGSGWHYLDKDMGTRPLFRHLAAQGHVIMDVAYRLCPETDWLGMQGDVKRAIAWMKNNAARYGVSPRRIVVACGSAGGHLALLAAYTAQQPDLRPADVGETDLSVCGVVSWYGPTDMAVYNDYAGRLFSTVIVGQAKDSGARLTDWLCQQLGIDTSTPPHWQAYLSVQQNMMRGLFGGLPAERPEVYRLASPVSHVGRHCPPTLLLQGEHDCLISAEAVRQMAERLQAAGVPVVHVEYPQTDHAFDVFFFRFSPAAQAALYETERFLALLPPTGEMSGRHNGAARPTQLEPEKPLVMAAPVAAVPTGEPN